MAVCSFQAGRPLLDAGWPKQRKAEDALAALIPGTVDHSSLQASVSDRSAAPQASLPDTGIGLEMERLLSSQFIVTQEYGTRATTTLAVHHTGRADFLEQSFSPGGLAAGQRRFAFRLKD